MISLFSRLRLGTLQCHVLYEVPFSFLLERFLVVGSSFLASGHCVVARAVEGFNVLPSDVISLGCGCIFDMGEGNGLRLLLLLFLMGGGVVERSREVTNSTRYPRPHVWILLRSIVAIVPMVRSHPQFLLVCWFLEVLRVVVTGCGQ